AHFPSKADLFHHVILDAAHEFGGMMRGARQERGDPVERLTAFMRAYARFMADPFVRSVLRLVTAERRAFKDTAGQIFHMGRKQVGGELMVLLEQLKAEGALVLDQASWSAGQLLGMVEHPLFLMPMCVGDGA